MLMLLYKGDDTKKNTEKKKNNEREENDGEANVYYYVHINEVSWVIETYMIIYHFNITLYMVVSFSGIFIQNTKSKKKNIALLNSHINKYVMYLFIL